MISRNHCAFRLSSEGQCVVIDNQSLNGVWVNGKRIEPQQPYPLSEGDVIQLGVPLRDKERAEYEYRLTRCEEELAPTGEVLGTGSSTRNKAGERVKRKHNCEEIEPGDMERASCCKNKVQRVCDSHPPGTSASQEAWSSTEECVNPGTFREGWSSTEECVHSGTSQEARSSTADCVNPGTFREAWSSTEECVHSGSSSKREAFPQTSASGRLRKVGVQGDSAQALMVPSGKSWQIEDLSARVHGLENQQEEQRFQQLECQHQQQQLLKEPLYTQQQQQEVKVQKDEAAAHFTDVLENELQCIICSEHLIEFLVRDNPQPGPLS
ncbi:E3 ubiquitin-protein ligase rnf8 [Carcharodon carcharias]|uniref:E3 ubiquitin-protein ligase rnf8 n=1 Tax=Carcharodon carcharias TaxID=13397 RepID=UPI001B7DC713|nr:E3 ubiquitin-protein ligase rnf8 [Carcharodon carcharias]